MTAPALPSPAPAATPAASVTPTKKPHRWRRRFLYALGILALGLLVARLALPSWLRWYVNRTISQSPLYRGTVGDISVSLWRGGYTIHDIRLDKTTGNVPVPFFYAKQVDLHLEWNALLSGKIVGHIELDDPALNFVDDKSQAASTGDGTGSPAPAGPWLAMIRDLFPLQINSAVVHRGTIHFHAFDTDPPVDVYLNNLEASVTNLTNIHDETKPLITTITATALAMDQAKFQFDMKLDPFSYNPTFDLAVRLVGLDVTQINALAQAYGDFDFEKGYFDLVVELSSREGSLEGYIKPLFRGIQVLAIPKDIQKDNPIEFFWEALVGGATKILSNPNRDQFGTQIPVTGNIGSPAPDILTTVGNILRNAFIRAYLPRFEGVRNSENADIQFGAGTTLDPTNPVDNQP